MFLLTQPRCEQREESLEKMGDAASPNPILGTSQKTAGCSSNHVTRAAFPPGQHKESGPVSGSQTSDGCRPARARKTQNRGILSRHASTLFSFPHQRTTPTCGLRDRETCKRGSDETYMPPVRFTAAKRRGRKAHFLMFKSVSTVVDFRQPK